MRNVLLRIFLVKWFTPLYLALIWTSFLPCKAIAQAVKSEQSAGTLLFFGDSITAGYGIAPEQAFPALIQKRISTMGWRMNVVNAGLSGETSAGGLRRIDWILRQKVSVFILGLGANDAMRGIDLAITRKNLEKILDRVRQSYPEAKLVVLGMQAPPNLGQTYTRGFRDMFPGLARQYKAALVPFLLQGVGGIPELNLADGIHPTVKGHAIIAESVWEILKPVLKQIKH